MPKQVLLVEDDPSLADAIVEGLLDHGIKAQLASNVAQAIQMIRDKRPDAVILDLMLAEEDGLVVLRSIRAQRDPTPVLILTALGSLENRVNGLNAGADDYLVKPFEMPELVARLTAITRRNQRIEGNTITFGPLLLDLTTRRVFRDGKELKLSPTETSLVELFIRHENQVLTRKMLCHQLWETTWEGETNVIEVHINRLRSKLDKGFEKSLIHTIRGRGYILSEQEPKNRQFPVAAEPTDASVAPLTTDGVVE